MPFGSTTPYSRTELNATHSMSPGGAHVGWLFFRELSNRERFAPDLLADKDIRRIDKLFPVIVTLSATLPAIITLTSPDASAKAHSKLCGSTVTVDVKVEGDLVTDFAHEVKACALGQASSSIMARHVVGSTAEELRAVREAMRRMLKENGPPPEGKWQDLAVLEPVRDFKARHASTMLTFDAVVDALGQAEARQAAAAE